MGNIRGASLNPIYSQLRNAQDLNVGEVNTFTDWSVEAGDVVTVTRDGQEYKMPVHNQKTNWNKQQRMMISSTGNEKRESITKASQKKFRGGGSGLQATRETYQSIITHYNEMVAGLVLESSSASLFVENKYTQMSSGLKLTSSSAALYVNNKYTQMSSGLKLTSSSAALYVNNKYTQMSSGLKLTSSSAALYVNDKYSQMSSGLKLTSSSASLYVNNKYTQMSSGLKLTSSSAALYVNNKYTQMSSGLKLTSSSAALYVENKYTQMSSGLILTSSSAALYVNNKYTQMSSGLNLTSSSAALYVENKYTQMKSGLDLTSSSASLFVKSNYDQMKSGLDLTSSSAALYVNNTYTQMQAGLDLTSTSATLYARSAENAAEIAVRINDSTGDSEIKLKADHVYIGNSKSTTVIDGKLNASALNATKVKSLIGEIAIIQAQTIEATSLKFSLTGASSGTYMSVREMVEAYKIVQSGNDYKLQVKRYNSTTWNDAPDSVTFSRATSLSGTWSGRSYIVTASPQGNTNVGIVYDGIVTTGPVAYNSQTHYVQQDAIVYSDDGEGDADQQIMVKAVVINATQAYNDGKTAGWDLARDFVAAPEEQTENDYIDVGIPGSTYNQGSSYRFTLDTDTNYAYIKNALNQVVARKANSGGGSHSPSIANFDTTGISKSAPGAASYISGRTKANSSILGSGKYFNFQAKCGTNVKNYYIET